MRLTGAQFNQLIGAIRNTQNPPNHPQNQLTTTVTETLMPLFCGRRRHHDKNFVKIQSFSEFLTDAQSQMVCPQIQTDAEKQISLVCYLMNLLVILINILIKLHLRTELETLN